MEIEKKMKMAVISGASHALRYKQEKKELTDEEVIQKVTREIEVIIEKIGEIE